jgi:uncharacterized membrane protein
MSARELLEFDRGAEPDRERGYVELFFGANRARVGGHASAILAGNLQTACPDSYPAVMAFCQNCGSPVEGRFCAKCGAPAGAGGFPQSPVAGGSGLTDNLASALCYIPIVGLIFLLVEPYNRNKLIRFHAWQSLFLVAAMFVLGWVISSFITILGGFYWAFYPVIRLAFFIVFVYSGIKAYKGQKVVLPVIGPLAEQQA